jgi:hypothetical protein
MLGTAPAILKRESETSRGKCVPARSAAGAACRLAPGLARARKIRNKRLKYPKNHRRSAGPARIEACSVVVGERAGPPKK